MRITPSLFLAWLSVIPTEPIGGCEKTALGMQSIVDGARLVAELGVGEGVALADRDGGELDPVGDVADGEDRGTEER